MTTPQRQAQSVTVEELFYGEDRYVIPLYQRNYTWGEDEIIQLVSDIAAAAEAEKPDVYHLGNLVVSPRGDNQFEVIDGQQRLTTLFMLLAHLDPAAEGATKAHPPTYEARPKASRTLELLPEKNEKLPEGERLDAVIADASALIHMLALNKDREKLIGPDFACYLKSSVKLVRMTIPQSTDLNRYFEVMNTRGVQLRPVDIVKARLMKYLQREDQSVFEAVWRGSSDMTRYVQMGVTRDDTVLRSRLFGDTWTSIPSDFAKLRDALAPDAPATTTEAGEDEPVSLENAVDQYLAGGIGSKKADDEDGERFSSQITFEVLLLHILALKGLGEDGDRQLDDKKLVSRFEQALDRVTHDQSGPPVREWVQNFAVALLRYRMLFDRYIIKRDTNLHPGSESTADGEVGDWSLISVRSSQGANPQPRYSNTFSVEAQKNLVLLQSALRITYTSPRTMHWMTEVLRHVDQNPELSGDDLLAFIQNWTRGRVREAMAQGSEGALPSGFGVPRIMFTYLDYLLVKDEQSDYRFSYRNSIEHFLPQSWDREKSNDKFDFTDKSLLNDFGNLALVSVSVNSKFSNNTPAEKATYTSARAQSPKLELMCKVVDSLDGQWKDHEAITHRDEMLALLRADLSC